MSERQVKFRLGQLDLTLVSALTAADVKRMRAAPELAKKDPWGMVELVIDILWKCAHAGDASVTREMIESNLVLPDGMEAVMAALVQVTGPVSNDLTAN